MAQNVCICSFLYGISIIIVYISHGISHRTTILNVMMKRKVVLTLFAATACLGTAIAAKVITTCGVVTYTISPCNSSAELGGMNYFDFLKEINQLYCGVFTAPASVSFGKEEIECLGNIVQPVDPPVVPDEPQ